MELAKTGLRNRLPVLDPQARDPAKLAGVVRDERQVLSQRDRGDRKVIGTQRHAARGNIRANPAENLGGGVIKRQAGEERKELAQQSRVGRQVFRRTTKYAIVELGNHDGA